MGAGTDSEACGAIEGDSQARSQSGIKEGETAGEEGSTTQFSCFKDRKGGNVPWQTLVMRVRPQPSPAVAMQGDKQDG